MWGAGFWICVRAELIFKRVKTIKGQAGQPERQQLTGDGSSQPLTPLLIRLRGP